MIVKSLTLENNDIPEQLKGIPNAPKKLYYRGIAREEWLSRPLVAVVGSRKTDEYGKYATKSITTELARFGVVIVSGLAMGVDAIAHQSALDEGGITVAISPCGIDSIYPRTNGMLGKKIINQGALISEHEGNYSPHPHDFLIRNRLISGLSMAVLVTQAAARSGSLNTANHALEQGKIVMAVPGPINNPLCEGPNNLIKMGAIPVTCAEDVLKALDIRVEISTGEKDYDLLAHNAFELKIIQLLRDGIADGEELAQKSAMTAQEFNTYLTMLEIRNVIVPLGSNKWSLN
ncbi:DNA-processing protein DprA [Candidatus Saccharibacteria bacterium]|nr:DNA-processing protein DprA [Candidatus Saccharibacteria bacterium]